MNGKVCLHKGTDGTWDVTQEVEKWRSVGHHIPFSLYPFHSLSRR